MNSMDYELDNVQDPRKRDQLIRCEIYKNGWSYNNFTCFLVESHLTASKVAMLMDINPQTAYHWL